MTGELRPDLVAARLAALRRLYLPERTEEGRLRLARERPPTAVPFERAVELRLAELRALCDLASHLHRAAKR